MDDHTHKPGKDKELSELLSPLTEETPSALQMQSWKKAVRTADQNFNKKPVRKSSYALSSQLIAAMLVGFIIGALLFKNANSNATSMDWAKNLESPATYERIHTNLD